MSNVAIYKIKPDGRRWTSGFKVPDFQVLVVPFKLSHQERFSVLKARGYVVADTEFEPGTYDREAFMSGVAKKEERVEPPRPSAGRGGAYGEVQEARPIPQADLEDALS